MKKDELKKSIRKQKVFLYFLCVALLSPVKASSLMQIFLCLFGIQILYR